MPLTTVLHSALFELFVDETCLVFIEQVFASQFMLTGTTASQLHGGRGLGRQSPQLELRTGCQNSREAGKLLLTSKCIPCSQAVYLGVRFFS